MEIEEQAQIHEAKEWEERNKARPERKVYAPGEDGYGREFCIECESQMPPLRRSMGCMRCTSCTEFFDKQKARGPRH
jgi:hypothetical protein